MNDTLQAKIFEITMGHETQPERDEVLVQTIASGEKCSLEILYQRHGKQMYAFALRLVGDPTTAEDVLQESLVAAWQGASRFRGEGRVIAWLLGIVRNKARRALRGRPIRSPDGEAQDSPDTGPTPDELTTRAERSRLLRTGLSQLSIKHRSVLELVFYHDLSLRETAQVLRCPVGTVKSRLSYAKKALGDVLRGAGVSMEDLG